MAPVPAWTREWRPLTKQLCAHFSSSNQDSIKDRHRMSQEDLLLRADHIVGQLYAHRFVDCVPQDVQTQTRALATKFRIHSLDDRADVLLQLAPQCDYQVLKLLLELATSPTTSTDAQVAVNQDSYSRWKEVLEHEKFKQQEQKMLQDQLVDELFQISTNDEWYQAWDDSDEGESDWETSSADERTGGDGEHHVDTSRRNAKRSNGALDEGRAIEDEVGTSLDSQMQNVRGSNGMEETEKSQVAVQDELLCRYHSEIALKYEPEVADDTTCELDMETLVPFTLERPWLLCKAVVKGSETAPCRVIHEEIVVRMVFEALDGVDSLLFDFRLVTPTPSMFGIGFQTMAVERSQRSLSVVLGHLSPSTFHHVLDDFAQAASELQVLRDLLRFIRQTRQDLNDRHPCVTLEGLANSLSEVMRSLNGSIRTFEEQVNAATTVQVDDSCPWSGVNARQPTLLGIYSGLKKIFTMISWLKRVLVESFQGLSDRCWHEVKHSEQAKCVLDSLYHMMEVEYVEGVIPDTSFVDELSRSNVLLHLFVGALSPYLDLINRMIFEPGHFKTIPLDDELFFTVPAPLNACVSSSLPIRIQSFREGLLSLAPFKANRLLVPTFLASNIDLMSEALASRQIKNRFLQCQQHSAAAAEPLTRPEQSRISLHELFINELETMGCRHDGGTFSATASLTPCNEEASLSSQQILLECIPFNKVLERCLTRHLETKCRELNGEMTDIFRDKMNYMDHVEALRMFVLMEQQDVFTVFSEKLVTHMQTNPVAWADSEMINSFHQSAVQGVFEDNSLSGLQRQLGGRLCVRVNFDLLDCTPSGAKIDIATMKCMYFTFSAQPPLHVLFSTSVMRKYSRLGVLLVQVKAVESALVKFKSRLRHRHCYALIEGDMRQLLVEMADMLHYTKCLLNYLTSQMSSGGWSKYRQILQSAQSLQEMNAAHEEYLDHLLNRFFLQDKHATVIQYILTTFNHILRFVGHVEDLVSAVDRNVPAYVPECSNESEKKSGQSVRLLEHPDFRVLRSEMTRNSKEFKRQSHFLVVMLTAMQKRGASPHVNEIVTQLNYNYFYHQQENFGLR